MSIHTDALVQALEQRLKELETKVAYLERELEQRQTAPREKPKHLNGR